MKLFSLLISPLKISVLFKSGQFNACETAATNASSKRAGRSVPEHIVPNRGTSGLLLSSARKTIFSFLSKRLNASGLDLEN
jgi:hypothetical protein